MGILSHTCQYTNINARGKENEHCSCEKIFHPCPSPRKGTPLLSPCLKPGVLRGGGDKRHLAVCEAEILSPVICLLGRVGHVIKRVTRWLGPSSKLLNGPSVQQWGVSFSER